MTEAVLPHPLTLVSHIDALPAGARLAEFEIIGLLGVGGFGMVYQAFDHSLQRQVAIKEYMPSALAGRSRGMTVSMRSAADTQTFMAGLKSFVAEARLLAQFDHPSLVKVFRFWEANNTAYMVMPLYSGVTFKAARSHMRGPPPEAWLRKVLWSMLGALRVLHDGRTMHRDVSPDNIFLQDNGPPVLLDLGAARRAISDKSQKHTAILKVNYAPIEQYADAEDMRQGPWTDLYSLGAVVHGCLCNEPPMPATFRVLRDRMPPFESVAATVKEQFGQDYSPEFVAAISHALAIRPEDRPQTVAAFADEMALQAPGGMSKFDWRAELGDLYLPEAAESDQVRALYTETPSANSAELRTQRISSTIPGDALAGGGPVIPEVELPDVNEAIDETSPMTPQAQARAASASAAAAAEKGRTNAAKGPAQASAKALRGAADAVEPVPPPPRRIGLFVAAGLALAVAGGLFLVLNREPAVEPAAAAEPAAAPAMITETREEAGAAVPAPAVAPASAAVLAASVPLAAASAAARPASAPASAAWLAASAARKPGVQAAVVPAPETRPVPAAAASAPVDSAAAPRPLPAPPRPAASNARPEGEAAAAAARTDGELCADSSFLARPMCLHRECQRPELANLAVCVEQKRRFQNRRDPSMQ